MIKLKNRLFLLIAIMTFAISCSNPTTNPVTTKTWKDNVNYKLLLNVWENPSYKGEIYEYKEGYFYAYGGSYGTVTYSMTVDEIVWGKDNTSGIMYGKYLESWDSSSVGKYYAVSFQKLTANSISISGALNSDGKYTADSLEEAKKIFTEENKSFSVYSDCTQYNK